VPYLTDFGYPGRYAGPEAITYFCNFLQNLFPGVQFEHLKILIETPDQVFAEYEFTAVSTATRQKIHQLFFGRLVAKNGRIKLVREALNAAEVARALYPQGIPDLPPKAAGKTDSRSAVDLARSEQCPGHSVHASKNDQ